MSDIDMYDRVNWWLAAHHTDADVAKKLRTYAVPSPLSRLYALTDDVIEAPDKNNLHRRIYAGAVADRLEGK